MSRRFVSAALAACFAALPMSAIAEYRGSYELVVNGADGTASVRSTSTHRDGEAIRHEIGKHLVWLLPIFSDDGSYFLAVSAVPLERTEQDIELSHALSFPGQERTPLEFEATLGEISVTGAVVLQRIAK